MTIEEIQKARQQLEEDIRRKLEQFEQQTKMRVHAVDLRTEQYVGSSSIYVTLDVRLPTDIFAHRQ